LRLWTTRARRVTAAPLAARAGGPLLLVGDALTPELARELERLGARNAVIVGGPGAVPVTVAEAVAAEGITVRRLAGANRFETAAAIARDLGASAEEVIVASGERFPDALSIAPVAASQGLPILLTAAATLPAASAQALTDLGVQRTIVVGGRAAISRLVADALPAPTRVAGPERYATSAAVAAFAVRRGADLSQVGIATGRAFPDALAAGPVASVGYGGAAGGGVVLLVDGADATGARDTQTFLMDNRAAIDGAVVFGGTAAISDAVARRIDGALR
jgi:lactocepin